jgi:hypothetical protein
LPAEQLQLVSSYFLLDANGASAVKRCPWRNLRPTAARSSA